MKRTIVFSKNAEKGLSELFEYLESRWSERIKNNFISNLDKVIYLIQIEPEIFPKSELNKNYRNVSCQNKRQFIINSIQKE